MGSTTADNRPATSDKPVSRRPGTTKRPNERRRPQAGKCCPTGKGAALAAALLAAMLCGSCITPRQSLAVDVDPATWEQAAEVTLMNDDTLTLRDINLFLRCNKRFDEDTLTVHITTLTPDSLRCEEPLLLALPHNRRPAALAAEAVIPYRRRVRFDRTGNYRIRITPARPVRGIEAAGIHIVKSE